VVDLLRKGRASGKEFAPALWVVGGIGAACFLVLAGRLYHLQVSLGREYYDRSVNNFVKELKIPADRGHLMDRHGDVLADSRPSYDLYLTPYFCGKVCDEVVTKLSAYLELSSDEQQRVRARLKAAKGLSRFQPFLVKVDIGRDLVDVFAAHRAELDGIDMLPAPHRNYRLGKLAGHALGYLSEVNPDELETLSAAGTDYHEGDYVGRRGVERAFESELRGKDGVERVVVDAKGRRLDKNELLREADRVRPPRPGRNVVLSLDRNLQAVAEETFPGQAGAIVALDPRTGFILVLLSRPELDPNLLTGRITKAELEALAEDPLQPEIFRPLQEQYHPGSTFKPVTALAGLERGAITKTSTIGCNGGYKLGTRRWRCWQELGHGTVNLHRALVQSCDSFFYWVGDRTGIDPMAQMARSLGLGQVTGLGIGAEVPGVIPDVAYHNQNTPGGYFPGYALNAAIGQGDVNVTPMQMAVLYAALGNGGTVYRPQLVKRIEDVDGKSLKSFSPEVRGHLAVKPEDLALVVDGLRGVVNEPGGTAYGHRLPDIEVAGKTGTAQVIAMGEKRVKSADLDYEHGDHAWFAAFAPAENPEIVVVVLNEHAGHGGSASAPTAMAIIKAYFDAKKPPEETQKKPDAAPPEHPDFAPANALPPGPGAAPKAPPKPELGSLDCGGSSRWS
jgi:penicillin-binding protein 2